MTTPPNISPPNNHEWLATKDGSWTIYSKQFNEGAHSTHGAIAETKLRYIEGCQLYNPKRYHDPFGNYKIFEVGLGLGIGALESFVLWYDKFQHLQVEFISCEIDEELILWCKKNLQQIFAKQYPSSALELVSSLELHVDGLYYQSQFQNKFKLKVFRGDILNHQNYITQNYQESIDSIFQDAYSPKKNPTLWSLEWFSFLKKLTHKNSILSTYSSSSSVRTNLESAGFYLTNGPGFGKKKSSTIAFAKQPEQHQNNLEN
jgi:tRNA U34 5-methylaminomethyl-2-thiouridine-forming methyltransferase MnmC